MLRRMLKAMPSSPMPIKARLEGSGTDVTVMVP
jgi:hypothetical protein